MGAHHFLDHGFTLLEHFDDSIFHELQLYEQGGEPFFRLWVGGEGKNKPILCRLTYQQARDLADGAEALAFRLGL